MEFIFGYLIGSGANWQTILVTMVLCLIIAIFFFVVFGVEL